MWKRATRSPSTRLWNANRLLSQTNIDMRFRIILPLVSVVLGVLLFRLGDIQVKKIVTSAHGAPEGTPIEFAMARYPHYALNAPAWAVLREERGMLWSPSTYWTGRDLRYFLAVIALWYLIGLHLDKRFALKRAGKALPRTWLGRIFAWACVAYGLFVCLSVLPDFIPLKGYGVWFPNRHPYWFIAAVLGWGTAITVAGLYSLFRRNNSTIQS